MTDALVELERERRLRGLVWPIRQTYPPEPTTEAPQRAAPRKEAA